MPMNTIDRFVRLCVRVKISIDMRDLIRTQVAVTMMMMMMTAVRHLVAVDAALFVTVAGVKVRNEDTE